MKGLLGIWVVVGLSVGCMAMEVQGHRGARDAFPENSLPAFASALEAGIDVIELDLLMTRDGVIVIHHDYYLNEQLCTYLNQEPLEPGQLIHSLTLAQVKDVDCGCRQNRAFPEQKTVVGTQIPTLEELFQMIASSSLEHAKTIRLNLELKRDPRHPEWSASPEELALCVTRLVAQYGLASRIYYSSFDPESLAAIRKIKTDARLGLIYNQESLDEAAKRGQALIQIATALRVDVLSPEHELLHNAEEVEHLHQAGFCVVPWTVNDPQRWKELSGFNVDGMITDHPAELKQFLLCQ